MINEGVHFRSVVSRWFEIWENKCPNSNQKKMHVEHVYMTKVPILSKIQLMNCQRFENG